MKLLLLLIALLPFNVFAGSMRSIDLVTAQSMGASFNSQAIDASAAPLASIQGVWAGGGSPVGQFKVQVSNDQVDTGAAVTNWSDYPGSTIAIATDGDIIYNIANLGYRWARLVYTRTSGTATVNAKAVLKSEARL